MNVAAYGVDGGEPTGKVGGCVGEFNVCVPEPSVFKGVEDPLFGEACPVFRAQDLFDC